ncbi:MAG TPA: SCO family protein [Thermoanaerobaculia bacterium]|nr:SCO family protein [Thermoanaerobaculia bacterium]
MDDRHPPEAQPAMTSGRRFGRGLLWGLLLGVLVAVVAAALWKTLGGEPRPEPPPVLVEVGDFTLVDQAGETVTRDDLLGAPWIADLLFTRCVLACPLMSTKMARLDRELPRVSEQGRDPAVRLVSISVDPEHDTPEVLREFAAKYDASDRWLFLTGERDEVIAAAGTEGLRLPFDPNPPLVPLQPGDNIFHSTRFVLVDAEGRVRGYYESESSEDLARLRRELATLL